MNYKIILIVIAMLFIISKKTSAQSNNDQIEFTYIEGIKEISPDYNVRGKIPGGELAYHFNMQGNSQDYVKFLKIRSIDIVGSYRNLKSLLINNNPKTKDSLGKAYSVLGRLEVQLLKFGPAKLLFTPGFGFTYSTVSYFSNGNPFVGSKINLAAQSGIKILYSITPSTGIQAGADLFHYSNGGERLPNNGVTSIDISFGIVQNINQPGPSAPKRPFVYDGVHSFEFSIDFGERGLFGVKKELYRSGLYAGYSYRLNSLFSLRGGIDAGYYFTPFNPANYDNTFENYGTSFSKWRLGMSAGADIRLGRLAVFGNYGYYLYYRTFYQAKTDFSRELNYRVKTYFTPGLRYYVCDWLALQIKQYTNHGSADYLGLGALFRIH